MFKKSLSVLLIIAIVLSAFSVAAFAAAPAPSMVLIGDSIAAGTNVGKDEGYGIIVARSEGYNYYNYAVAGTTSFVLEMLIDQSTIADSLKKADIIVISTGGNNLLLDNVAGMGAENIFLNDTTLMQKVADEFYKSFCNIMDKVKKLNPNALIMVQTIYNPMTIPLVDKIYENALTIMNKQFTKYLKEHPKAFTLVDVHGVINNDGKLINFDFVHPNKFGHYEIAKEYIRILYKLGYGKAKAPKPEYAPKMETALDYVNSFRAKIL